MWMSCNVFHSLCSCYEDMWFNNSYLDFIKRKWLHVMQYDEKLKP